MSAPTKPTDVISLHLTATECSELECILQHVIEEMDDIGDDQVGCEQVIVQGLLQKIREAQN